MAELAQARWGDIVLFCSQINTDGGRTQVVHEPASGDRHVVQNRGLRVRRTRCRLQFDEFPGSPSPVDAALALEEAKNSGEERMFSHPLLGRFLAGVGEFTSEISESGIITGECEFISESEDQVITPTGPASSGASGEAAVNAAAAEMDDELESIGQLKMSGPTTQSLLSVVPDGADLGSGLSVDLSVNPSINLTASLSATIAVNVTASAVAAASGGVSVSAVAAGTVTADADLSVSLAAAASSEASAGLFAAVTIDARVAVSAWASGEVSTRQILIDAARVTNNIATAIEVGGFETDLALWPAYRASILLFDSVRSAAVAATSDTPSVFVMLVQDPTALLALCARVYGGAEAQDRAAQVATLNDISTPGWIAPGSYLMPTRTSSRA